MNSKPIKFRVWDCKARRMIYLPALSIIDRKRDNIGELTSEYFTFYQDDEDLMQFSGLYDINGVEIYEGDIINYWPSCAKGYRGDIAAMPSLMKFHWYAELQYMLDKDNYDNQCEIKVVGNIFENKDLLNIK